MMKFSFLTIVLFIFGTHMSFAQTAEDAFLQSKVKMNESNNPNYWVHGDNIIKTRTENDWNQWDFGYMGLEGSIQSNTTGDFTSWKVNNSDITIEQNGSSFNNWTISNGDKSVQVMTSNWNTWAITGDVVSGFSTTVNDDFSEWKIQNGDWTDLSPQFRASVIFISAISSSILKDYSE